MPYASEPSKDLPKVQSGPAAGGQDDPKNNLVNWMNEVEKRLAHLERLSRISNVPTETRTY